MRQTHPHAPAKLAALLLAAALLAGCAVRLPQQPSIPKAGDNRAQTPGYSAPIPTANPKQSGQENAGSPERSAFQQAYGSAALLAWPTVLVSIYLDETGGASWDEQAIAQSRSNLAVAVEWIGEQCAGYGAAPKIYYDDGTDENRLLFYQTRYPGQFAGGIESEESGAFYDALDELCAALDTETLHQRYGTSSVGFLVFLPVEGSSFTMVHYADDGSYYYEEYSVLYAYDAALEPSAFDTPAVYAHEILHLFGAPDLYEGSSDHFVTPELVAYVASTWPDAIMYSVESTPGVLEYDAINQSISPLTAYRLGLCDKFPGMEEFPNVTLDPPGVFTDEGATLEDDRVAA